MLMQLKTKCPDCQKPLQKDQVVYLDEGTEGDLALNCKTPNCGCNLGVHWKVSVKTRTFRMEAKALDLPFQVDLIDESPIDEEAET